MNLELLPAKLNRAKSDKVTERVKVFAKELYEARLLLEEGWVGCQASPANSDCNLAHSGHIPGTNSLWLGLRIAQGSA
jgi:hypothetical protein